MTLCFLAACVQRRADGRRGTDTGSATDSALKVDTGVAATPQERGNAVTLATTTPTVDTAEQPFMAARVGVPGIPAAPIAQQAQTSASTAPTTQSDIAVLAQRHPIVPIAGISAAKLPDTFDELRGGTRKHEALDILAPRGTPVHSADDGTVIKLFTSKAGGLTVYVTGPDQRFVYYYAHLNAYANGLAEGQMLHKGDVIGYVGTTGNADPNVPHLHFAIARTDNIREWWKGEPINPTTVLQAAAQDRVR